MAGSQGSGKSGVAGINDSGTVVACGGEVGTEPSEPAESLLSMPAPQHHLMPFGVSSGPLAGIFDPILTPSRYTTAPCRHSRPATRPRRIRSGRSLASHDGGCGSGEGHGPTVAGSLTSQPLESSTEFPLALATWPHRGRHPQQRCSAPRSRSDGTAHRSLRHSTRWSTAAREASRWTYLRGGHITLHGSVPTHNPSAKIQFEIRPAQCSINSISEPRLSDNQ